MNYWANKTKAAAKAIEHTAYMANRYPVEIDYAVRNTIRYNENSVFSAVKSEDRAIARVIRTDSVTAVVKAVEQNAFLKTAVLNFASYNNPGGRFLDGSTAQEESLCHSSFLYNVLKEFNDTYYEDNRHNKNRGLYKDRALYTPNVYFRNEEGVVSCDVITCAAPNKSLLYKYGNFTEEENSKVLRNRIKFVLNIAAKNYVDILILGAWGCGVFKQDPIEVATMFKKEIEKLNRHMNIFFAIPDDKNYNAFGGVFNNGRN